MLIVVLASCCPAAEPSLVFSKADVAELRSRAGQGAEAIVWKSVLGRTEELCRPESRRFADPQRVKESPKSGVSQRLWVHSYGRRLTDWMENIGFAYQLTGQERFGRHGALILEAAARELVVTDPTIAQGFTGGRGDIMRGLALGYDWLGEAMTPRQRRAWAETSAAYVRSILAEAKGKRTWWVPYHNYMGVAVGAAGCLSLKLREFFPEDASAWVAQCMQIVQTWLDKGFDDQGAGLEGSMYACYGLSNTLLFAEALRRDGGRNLWKHPHLIRFPHFLAMSVLPGESVLDARNDSDYVGLPHPWLLQMARQQRSGLPRWLWDQCGGGDSPLRIVWGGPTQATDPSGAGQPWAEHFVGRGLVIFRTGWTRQDAMFAIESGKYYPGTHNQADKGHFTLYAYGGRWAIDSGYGNNQQPEGKAQTVAHNCVLIDGRGQAISGAGAGTDGKIAVYQSGPQFGYVLADCTEAYQRSHAGKPGPGVFYARRHALFIRPSGQVPAYAVVLDDIQKDSQIHDFTWLLHTSKEMEFRLEPNGAVVRRGRDTDAGPRMQLHLYAAAPMKMEFDSYAEHPRLKATVRAVKPEFVALLFPLMPKASDPQTAIETREGELRIRVQWPQRTDQIVWPTAGERRPMVTLSVR